MPKHLKISIISFVLCVLAVMLVFFSIRSSAVGLITNQTIRLFFGGLLIFVLITSIVLAFIDVISKNRKKTFSIIALVIRGGFFGLFLCILSVLTLYRN